MLAHIIEGSHLLIFSKGAVTSCFQPRFDFCVPVSAMLIGKP